MRSTLLMLGGLVLLVAGIIVLAVGLPGALAMGPALIVAGRAVKGAVFLRSGDTETPPRSGTGRTATTLGPSAPERTGTGAAGRASAGRRMP